MTSFRGIVLRQSCAEGIFYMLVLCLGTPSADVLSRACAEAWHATHILLLVTRRRSLHYEPRAFDMCGGTRCAAAVCDGASVLSS
jgi:hypothetical protein